MAALYYRRCCFSAGAELVIGLILLFALSVYQGVHAEASQFPDIDDRVLQYIEKNPDVSMDIALVHEGEIILSRHFSKAGMQSNSENEYIYRAGSMAKVLTALGILKLEDLSEIDIDQPVFSYLPRFFVKRHFSNARPITLRHVLTHHSGLPGNIIKGQWTDAHFSTVVEQLRLEYLSYPPDFVQAYSNVGYSVLGALIEEVTGQSYEGFIREQILMPLQMKHTGFDRDISRSSQFVAAYKAGRRRDLLAIRDLPAMGLNTTAEDMARLLVMLMGQGQYRGQSVMAPEMIEEMLQQHNEHVELDYDNQTGIGLVLNHCMFEQDGDVIEHGGHTMHYASHFVAVPKYKVGAVVLSNSRDAKRFTHVLARDLVARALKAYYPDVKQQQARVEKQDKTSAQQSEKDHGMYLTKSGLLTLQVDESDMCACVDKKRLDLVPMPDGWYGVKNKKKDVNAPSVAFSPQQISGEEVLVVRAGDKQQRLGDYIDTAVVPDSWKGRLGDYVVVNPDTDFPVTEVCLTEEDNLLYLSYRMPKLSDRHIGIPLTLLDDTQAVTTGLGRDRGESVVVMNTDQGELLLYSGYLVKKKPVESYKLVD